MYTMCSLDMCFAVVCRVGLCSLSCHVVGINRCVEHMQVSASYVTELIPQVRNEVEVEER